jgi:uncharacterized protein with PQ loop repeat
MEGVGLVGGALTATMSIPQAVRIFRRKEASGVSPSAFGGFAGVALSWVIYGIEIERWAVLVSNLVMFVTAASVIVGLAVVRAPVRRAVGVLVGCIVLSVVLLSVSGPTAVGWWAVVLTGLIRLPQLLASGADRVSGISANAWIMVTAGNVLWLAYGIYFDDARITTGSVLATVLGIAILVRTERSRRREAPESLEAARDER